MAIFKEWYLLVESKQLILGMGFPEVISKMFYEKFPKNAVLIAKWYKGFKAFGSAAESPNWWQMAMAHRPLSGGSISLYELTNLYESTKDKESYLKAIKWSGFDVDEDEINDYYLQEQRDGLLNHIREDFFKDCFFSYSIVKDIMDNKLTDLSGFKGMSLTEAQHKYDRRNIFKDIKPLKVYANGFKWINVGKRCMYLGSKMGNCGSAGLMSMDEKATIIALFGPNNKPHVMVTYSPSQNRISGDESSGSTAVKEKYHDYVLDLTQHLGAELDVFRSKSVLLGIKYRLRGKLQGIEDINSGDEYNKCYRMNVGGMVYFTDGYTVVSEEDVRKAYDMIQKGEITLHHDVPPKLFSPAPVDQTKNMVMAVLSRYNAEYLRSNGISYTPMGAFASGA